MSTIQSKALSFLNSIKHILILIGVLGFSQDAFSQYRWQVSSINTFTGGQNYCLNEAASPLTLNLFQCSGGIKQPHYSTIYNITWYVNSVNSTSGGTAVSSHVVTTPHSFFATQYYTPPTNTEGTFYYYAKLTSPSLTTCGFTDSLVSTVQTVVVTAISSTDTRTECSPYTWINGVEYTSNNNTASFTIANGAANGCDSIVNLDLTILPSQNEVDTRVACDSYTWIDGVTYTSSNNSATHTLTNIQGCDSIITLNLTINESNTGVDVQTACNSYTWIDGVTYTTSNNSATHTLTNIYGCDSVVTLNLTINESNTGVDIQTACDSYTWMDGVTYTTSNNSATHTLTNVSGCDSVVTLNLTIINYCNSRSTRNAFEWIKKVELGSDIDNLSNKDNGGYGNYSDQTLEVDTGEVVTVTLTPGYKRRVYVEYWRIWADWNYDGDFNDNGELVFQQAGKNIQTGSFVVPTNVDTNTLRVRTSMRWKKYASACSNFRNGEVEDYSIKVNGAQGYVGNLNSAKYHEEEIADNNSIDMAIVETYPNPISQGNIMQVVVRADENMETNLIISDILGQIIKVESTSVLEGENILEFNTSHLKPGLYFMSLNHDQLGLKFIVK